ncbi:hypothetical protein EZZ81_24440 [Pseudomonas viridiflava]|uniref:Uncharacterized protein n=1 Tax=Pseudomonas viridiflava TaxID=33069 RepID=A0AA46W3E0_PSEVI|nr:hypothetical protein EZZ81_24440 [Pseudomonas viridiflava]
MTAILGSCSGCSSDRPDLRHKRTAHGQGATCRNALSPVLSRLCEGNRMRMKKTSSIERLWVIP